MVDVRTWKNKLSSTKPVVMGIDVGGTNTNIALAIVGKKPSILISFHYATQNLKNLERPVQDVLKFAAERRLRVKTGCIAAAGPHRGTTVQGTNFPFSINAQALAKKSKVRFSLINDFEAVARGIPFIPQKDIRTLQKGKETKNAVRVIVGAGSGLGKSILIFDAMKKRHVPLASEGGHADFPFTANEFDMCRFFSKRNTCPDEESMVSGKGIGALYTFFRPAAMSNRMVSEIDQAVDKAKIISKYYHKDKLCKQTLDVFARFYARVLRNFCLNTLPYGGAFIAGGIAAKNRHIFGKEFLAEFLNTNAQSAKILKSIPLYVIMNYDVSLYGAVVSA